MEYDRLTKRLQNGEVKQLAWDGEILHRLAGLEDMIKSGQAVILQAKIGDWVYGCSTFQSKLVYGKIERIDISGYFGTTYHVYEKDSRELYLLNFVSKNRHAAEAKLKELRGE